MAREKTRVNIDEKGSETPDKNEVICPLVLLVTKKIGAAKAVNYDLAYSPLIKLGDAAPGVWRSAPQLQLTQEGEKVLEESGYSALTEEHISIKNKTAQARSHSLQFYKTLEEGKSKGVFNWDENAYYFTHEEGVNARKEYESLVLEGKAKAQKRSWVNRFAKLTGTSFDELTEKFPEIYGAKSSSKSKDPKPETEDAPVEPEMSGEDQIPEPSDEDIMKAGDEIDAELEHSGEGLDKDNDLAVNSEDVIDEETVAAATMTEDTQTAETKSEDWQPWTGFDVESSDEVVKKLVETDFTNKDDIVDILMYEKGSNEPRDMLIKEIENLIEQKFPEDLDENWVPWKEYDSEAAEDTIMEINRIEDLTFLNDILDYEKDLSKGKGSRSAVVNAAKDRITEVETNLTTTFTIEDFSEPQRVTSDAVIWKGNDGKDHIAYLVDVESLDMEMFLPEGSTLIEDHMVRVIAKKEKEDQS